MRLGHERYGFRPHDANAGIFASPVHHLGIDGQILGRGEQSRVTGYAVVDVETTGLFPGGHDRIAEIGIVLVDPDGRVEDTWATLVDPGRDLGPQQVHGISAADVRHAPPFGAVAGHVAERLRGRTFVAHNAQFDRRFVWHAFAALGYDVPVIEPTTLCTYPHGWAELPEVLDPDAAAAAAEPEDR